jgi:hypothetical protein
MNEHIRARLTELLEAKSRHEGGRCRLCRDRPGQVLIVQRDQQPCSVEQEAEWKEVTALCPACGWQPDVVEVTEVVIHSRAQWQRFRDGVPLSEEP